MAAFRSLKAPAGAVVVHIGKSLVVVETDAILRTRVKKVAEHTRGLMMGNHFFEAMRDIGHVTACELVETMYALDAAAGDAPKIARLNDEARRFSIALQQYETHPFVYIRHDRVEMTTQIIRMRDINSMEEFHAWKAGLETRDRELMGFEALLV
ncbi:hypothetical protein VQ02_07375 [Methylobacterium variabile]|uniref:Uncharacterized protein n=1 Tax=Methylobacterium variabile TaxID=298794 RepID=A0A0J6T508_9HYPH|nr:hypothetical protein [Methylobacterium variabile]KMO40653.1 hypothetical protein VQ02_07375 [Methylobacterium variabile]